MNELQVFNNIDFGEVRTVLIYNKPMFSLADVYRDKKGKLLPYADKNNGLFEIKETFNEMNSWSGTQTLITPKGSETFRLLIKKGERT